MRAGQQRAHILDLQQQGVTLATQRSDLALHRLAHRCPPVVVVLTDEIAEHPLGQFLFVGRQLRLEITQALLELRAQGGQFADVCL